MRAKIVNRTYGIVGCVIFEADSKTEISEQDARKAQTALGFDPAGYDFYGFFCEPTDEGYKAHWRCYNNCE